jgi:hypothetical protein
VGPIRRVDDEELSGRPVALKVPDDCHDEPSD